MYQPHIKKWGISLHVMATFWTLSFLLGIAECLPVGGLSPVSYPLYPSNPPLQCVQTYHDISAEDGSKDRLQQVTSHV